MEIVADIKKVIKGLKECSLDDVDCKHCPYNGEHEKNFKYGCETIMQRDALKLLEDKEAKVEIEGGGSTWFYVCGECHTSISPYAKYCRECGRRLKWDENSMQT